MADLHLTRLSRDQQMSPDRNKIWTESEPNRRVPVVYYLSRNGQLEHPHFMEVPLSSPQGLFLRDVISRLNVLRGKGMATMYSWSCKRSYKNGFVWNDLLESDFIYPAHGHEYVLKGSELQENTFLESSQQMRSLLPPPEAPTATGDQNYNRRRRNQSCSSVEFNLQEYSVYKADSACRSAAAAADASTQTDDARRRRRRPPPEIVEEKSEEPQRDEIEIGIGISPPPSDSSPETLETLMKADGRLAMRPETANGESPAANNHHNQRGSKSSVLMQLISCGSISFKDCGPGQGGLGLVSQYKMRVPRGGRVKLEEKEYFSGSLVETKKHDFPTLKRSTSYNADR